MCGGTSSFLASLTVYSCPIGQSAFGWNDRTRSDSHFQVDLNYTQNFKVKQWGTFQLVADLFNVFDKQTGYSIEPRKANSAFGNPRLFFDPRRFQLMARFLF